DRNGAVKPIGLPLAAYADVRLSPDGKQIVFDFDSGEGRNIWVYPLSGTSSMRRLTFAGTVNMAPIWSEDGEWIVYRSDREGGGIYRQRADGSGAAERLTKPEAGEFHGLDSWVPREQKFFFVTMRGADHDIWTYSVPDKKTAPVIQVPSSTQNNAFLSPDGRWLAYMSNETGAVEVYVQPFPP